MRIEPIYFLVWIGLSAVLVRAEAAPQRPDLNAAQSVATCKLQALAAKPQPMYEQQLVIYSLQPPAEDPLANYERTPLGDWQMPAEADRNDPWLRLLLFGPKRPVVIDLAVFVDGKSFRDGREAWIDDLLAAANADPAGVAAVGPEKTTTDTSGAEAAPPANAEKPDEAEKSSDDAAGNNVAAESGTNPPETTGTTAKAADNPENSGTNSEAVASEDRPPAAEKENADEPVDESPDKTPASDESSDKESDEDKPDKKSKEDAEKKLPGITAKARQSPTMRERLMSYLATIGGDIDRDEIQWLIAESGAGPAIVVLGSSLSWQRASLAPLLTYLDQDSDGSLSAAEIAQADAMWKRADVDGNDVVEISELRRVTNHEPASPRMTGHSLAVPLDANTDWDALAANVAHIYADSSDAASTKIAPGTLTLKERMARGDSTLDGGQLRALCEEAADITVRVDFNTVKDKHDVANAISVIEVDPRLAASDEAVAASKDAISLDVGGDFVEFSAAQNPPGESVDAGASQLAVGAVIDGNPIERLLDGDQDGRFTLRERQELGGLLAALDRDDDGQVASDEIPVPIRLAVTLGPQVHQLLATPTGSARTIRPREAAPTAPDWFLSMDKNNDRDLSRGEFLGTTAQFKQFDSDSDGLLSVAEALKLSAGQ